ncbi:Alpha/Beta hydrolase protein [Polychytrium aggregatum]|uniref:Alpha/Beta hydrolase protein n=1 Tax=Polychytrium aggregatum TaxID=110093 RepID=UPI0022FDE251|nr:Alpha/Beta hydrolase protein [Polychytrium aggregatum]KAI9208558.1 Alpha/Beta hydrolase protein [Polychytrium aggregatum]
MSTSTATQPQTGAVEIPLTRGITVRAKTWGNPDNERILAVHGWLDNANSFDLIAPPLAENHYVVCIDLPGHGESDYYPPYSNYYLWEAVSDLSQVAEGLGWVQRQDNGQLAGKFTLLGHSLGGHISLMYAGTFPEHLKRLLVIESLGPTNFLKDEAEDLENFIRTRQAAEASLAKKALYKSIEEACQARTRGLTKISLDAAKVLCERGLREVPLEDKDKRQQDGGSETAVDGPETSQVAYTWTSDKRLLLRQFFRWSEITVLSFLKRISCPVLLIMGEDSILWKANQESSEWTDRLRAIEQLTKVDLPGGHHLHLEADTSAAVVESLLRYLQSA